MSNWLTNEKFKLKVFNIMFLFMFWRFKLIGHRVAQLNYCNIYMNVLYHFSILLKIKILFLIWCRYSNILHFKIENWIEDLMKNGGIKKFMQLKIHQKFYGHTMKILFLFTLRFENKESSLAGTNDVFLWSHFEHKKLFLSFVIHSFKIKLTYFILLKQCVS